MDEENEARRILTLQRDRILNDIQREGRRILELKEELAETEQAQEKRRGHVEALDRALETGSIDD